MNISPRIVRCTFLKIMYYALSADLCKLKWYYRRICDPPMHSAHSAAFLFNVINSTVNDNARSRAFLFIGISSFPLLVIVNIGSIYRGNFSPSIYINVKKRENSKFFSLFFSFNINFITVAGFQQAFYVHIHVKNCSFKTFA